MSLFSIASWQAGRIALDKRGLAGYGASRRTAVALKGKGRPFMERRGKRSTVSFDLGSHAQLVDAALMEMQTLLFADHPAKLSCLTRSGFVRLAVELLLQRIADRTELRYIADKIIAGSWRPGFRSDLHGKPGAS